MKNIIRYTLLIGIISVSCCKKNQIDFDSKRWKNWVETESTMNLRWDMHKDLIKKHKLIDLTETEIIDLLGEPGQLYPNKYQYNLGLARHGIDYGILLLEFENEKVIDFKIIKG